jgi:hypothetical protein
MTKKEKVLYSTTMHANTEQARIILELEQRIRDLESGVASGINEKRNGIHKLLDRSIAKYMKFDVNDLLYRLPVAVKKMIIVLEEGTSQGRPIDIVPKASMKYISEVQAILSELEVVHRIGAPMTNRELDEKLLEVANTFYKKMYDLFGYTECTVWLKAYQQWKDK